MDYLRVKVDGLVTKLFPRNGQFTTLLDLRLDLSVAIKGEYKFSLNGKDVLEDESTPLVDLGIVSSDLLYILKDQPDQTPMMFNFSSYSTPPWRSTINTDTCQEDITITDEASTITDTSKATTETGKATTETGKATTETGKETDEASTITDEATEDTADDVSLLCEELHLLMIGNGFKEEQQVNSNALNRFRYIAPIGPMIPVDMICTTVGPHIITHATIEKSNEVMTCVMSTNKFLSKGTGSTKSDILNSKELKKQFTDDIPHKLLTNIRRELDLPETGTILSLVHVAKFCIMSKLDIQSLAQLSLVCREFYLLSQDTLLWKSLFARDFWGVKDIPKKEGPHFWKELYKNEMKRQAKKRSNPLIPFVQPSPVIASPFLWQPPLPLPPRYRRPIQRARRYLPSTRSPLIINPNVYDPLNDLYVPSPFEYDF